MRSKDKCVSQWLSCGLYGIIPVYDNDGCNSSELLFMHSPPITVKRKVKTVINDIAAYYQKSLDLVNKYAMGTTGLRTMNPLPISPDIVLIPIKTRKPIGINDGSIGYIFLSAVSKADRSEKGTCLVLWNNSCIYVLEKLNTLKHRLINAKNVHNTILGTRLITGDNISIEEAAAQYNEPATKGDIIMLSKNIFTICDLLTRSSSKRY